jgi:putative transcriptional regulator
MASTLAAPCCPASVAVSQMVWYSSPKMRQNDRQEDVTNPEREPRNLRGDFLISHINLVDPNFYRSVILMITHDDEGAFGLVVNHPSRFTLGEVIDVMGASPASSIPVYVGGPVQREALFVLREEGPWCSSPAHSQRPVEGVVFEPATRSMMEYLSTEWCSLPDADRPAVRVYAGYSGWAPGQVEGEMTADTWVVVKATRSAIFHPNPQGAWAEAFAGKGTLHQIILQTGFKPSMN